MLRNFFFRDKAEKTQNVTLLNKQWDRERTDWLVTSLWLIGNKQHVDEVTIHKLKNPYHNNKTEEKTRKKPPTWAPSKWPDMLDKNANFFAHSNAQRLLAMKSLFLTEWRQSERNGEAENELDENLKGLAFNTSNLEK